MEGKRGGERRSLTDRRMHVVVAGNKYSERVRILKVRVIMITKQAYVGEFYLPEVKRRLSDAINDEKLFINLTNVVIDSESEPINFIALNKDLIVSVEELPLADVQDLNPEEQPQGPNAA